MTAHLRIAILVCLFIGTHTQEFDLFDALDADPVPTPAKPKSKDTDDLDLFDALAPETVTEKPKPPIAPPKDGGADPKKPEPKKPGDAKPDKPAVVPPKNGGTGGGSFGDSDLFDVSEGSDYKPDGGRSGGRASVPANDPNQGGADQPQDLDHLWGQLLKLLDANMPAEVQVWIDNLMGVVKPLIERANELFNMGQ